MFFSFIRECFTWLPSLICFAVIIGIVRSLLRNH